MATLTTGVFFVARARPETGTDASGNFTLRLRVIDRQGPQRVEPYVLTWAGPAAALWFNEHGHQLQPGQPLSLELVNPRSHPGMRSPETHATVARCALAPSRQANPSQGPQPA